MLNRCRTPQTVVCLQTPCLLRPASASIFIRLSLLTLVQFLITLLMGTVLISKERRNWTRGVSSDRWMTIDADGVALDLRPKLLHRGGPPSSLTGHVGSARQKGGPPLNDRDRFGRRSNATPSAPIVIHLSLLKPLVQFLLSLLMRTVPISRVMRNWTRVNSDRRMKIDADAGRRRRGVRRHTTV